MARKRIKKGTPLGSVPGVKKSVQRQALKLGITTVEEMLDVMAQSTEVGGAFSAHDFFGSSSKLTDSLSSAIEPPKHTVESYLRPMRAVGAPKPKGLRRSAVGFDASHRGIAARLPTGALAPTRRLMSQRVGEPPPVTREEHEEGVVVDLRDLYQGVRDQGERGTCVAHSTLALFEPHWSVDTGHDVDFSEQFLYWNCKLQDNAPNDGGTYQRIAVALLVGEGVCREQAWLYNPVQDAYTEGQGPPPDRALREADDYRPPQGIALDPRSSEVVRNWLDDGYPVSVSVPVYPSWWGQTPALYGHLPMPRPNETPEGGHAVCLVGYGYDPDFAGGGFFIVRNSWGTAWAPQSPFAPGYGTIPFAYVDSHNWESFVVAAI